MNTQKKVKFLIAILILLITALFAVAVFQVVDRIKTNHRLEQQKEQIEKLEKQLDYYENKNPDQDYDVISKKENK